MERDIISLLFEKKEEEEMFNFNSKEITKWSKTKSKASEELFDFIGKKVHPKSRQQLIELVEKYISVTAQYFECQNKMYYTEGIKDGNSLNLKVSNN